jgi:nitrogen fixation protein FixH
MSIKVAVVEPVPGKGGWFWALVPVALLTASVAGVGTMASIAARDPGFALEKNYYDRAVHWDRSQAQAAENARLGYRLSGEVVASGGASEVVLRFVDRSGAPVPGAHLTVEAFANARARDRRPLTFVEGENGSYRATLADARPGLWELRVDASVGGDHFTDAVRVDVPRSPHP